MGGVAAVVTDETGLVWFFWLVQFFGFSFGLVYSSVPAELISAFPVNLPHLPTPFSPITAASTPPISSSLYGLSFTSLFIPTLFVLPCLVPFKMKHKNRKTQKTNMITKRVEKSNHKHTQNCHNVNKNTDYDKSREKNFRTINSYEQHWGKWT